MMLNTVGQRFLGIAGDIVHLCLGQRISSTQLQIISVTEMHVKIHQLKITDPDRTKPNHLRDRYY